MGSDDYRKRSNASSVNIGCRRSFVRRIIKSAFLLALVPVYLTLRSIDRHHASEDAPSMTLRRPATSEQSYRPRSPPIPLRELVQTHVETSCPPGLLLVNDTLLAEAASPDGARPPPHRNIPRTIHMTSRTRCMPPEFIKVIDQWRHFPHHEFYFHNDAAMHRLLHRDWPEFPQLHQLLRCTRGGAGLADVWRALVLWEYGGIYSDIDNAPAKFHAEMSIQPDDDAYFVLERSKHLSQYFFAARPKHPLFFLLVQHMMSRLVALNDVSLQVVSLVTGPGATRMAFCNFVHGQGPNFPHHDPSSKCWYPKARLYRGIGNYSVRAVGTPEQSDEYVARDVIPDKNVIYQRMNMTYFRDIPKVRSMESCIERIYQAEVARGLDPHEAAA